MTSSSPPLLCPAPVAVCQMSAMLCCAVLCCAVPHRYQEKFYFSPGDTGFKVWDTKFGRIGAAICWDQWFPEAARCMALMGAEVRGSTAADSAPDDAPLTAPARHSHMVSGDRQPAGPLAGQTVCSSHMHPAWIGGCCWWWLRRGVRRHWHCEEHRGLSQASTVWSKQ